MEVDALKAFPALDSDETIRLLKEELPAYIVPAEEIAADTVTAVWWLRQQNLPSWKKAAKMVLTVQPSSAAAERVFSLLEAATGDCRVFTDRRVGCIIVTSMKKKREIRLCFCMCMMIRGSGLYMAQ